MGGIFNRTVDDEDDDDMAHYTPRDHGRRSADRPRINWSAVALVVSVALWLIGAASGLFGDYRKIGDRVTVLETQRIHDARRMERVEDKIDRILERIK